MKTLKAETIVKFHDLKEDRIREIGEQFTVSKERFLVLEERVFVRKTEDQREAADKE